jgi:hypothetical protein
MVEKQHLILKLLDVVTPVLAVIVDPWESQWIIKLN